MKKRDLFIHERMTLQDRVCQTLREAILRGDFKPGTRLVQDVLANEFGVSRMPIREALRQLESEGLVEFVPHKGAIVKEMTLGEVEEIYTLRATLEAMALKESMPNLTEADLDEISTLLDEMENNDISPQEFVESNKKLHNIFYKGLKWNKLRMLIAQLSHGISDAAPFIFDGQMEKSQVEHRSIFNAVKSGDKELAGDLMEDHIKRTGINLKKYMMKKENSISNQMQSE